MRCCIREFCAGKNIGSFSRSERLVIRPFEKNIKRKEMMEVDLASRRCFCDVDYFTARFAACYKKQCV